ncbi:MAG: VacB/RNase II family 3'-5' exoribonuclease [Phycisphaerales bacterium]|nr:VacB/RNase II family 3'-5' exoribonuclease [Phycisphaerales bacterium]
MSLKFKRRLLEHLQHERYAPATLATLINDLGIVDEEREEFAQAVDALVKGRELARDGSGRVQLPSMPDTIVGSFRKNPKGFGFVVPTGKWREGDVFIPPDDVSDALTGDTVKIRVYRTTRSGERDITGEIIEVIERRRAAFTGELVKRGPTWLVMPDGKELTQPIVVKDPAVKNASAGDKVVVEITAYPIGNELGEGVITKVLGEAGLPDVETQAVIEAYSLPGEFSRECVDQARGAAQQFEREALAAKNEPWAGRLDLREEFIITIDPPDSKDFDDAISISQEPDGSWKLGVHIADVAHFIAPGSPLDVEARARGNSVYLPRLVIPMLPEVLSNGICSLAEGVPRLTKSAFMRYDRDGRILSETVGATVIKSAKRLTYLEAQALIDGDLREARKHAKTEPKYTDQLIKTLRQMDQLAKAIRQRRRKAGMIHLDLPEVNLVFDDAGHVIDAQPEDDAFTHTLIEMFMVEANEVLARLFADMGVPLLRRVHPEPPPGDVQDLRNMAKVAGYAIPRNPTRQELQGLLDATAGTSAARAVHLAVLRTLTKAEYSPADIGHFALASDAYAHFTSPIRRYADLTVHRALAAYLSQTDNARRRPRNEHQRIELGRTLMAMGPNRGVLEEEELVEIGRHITTTEGNAEAAERNLRQFLVLQLLTSHLGESFPGLITGVTGSGVFVQIEKYLAEGMIKTADLPTGQGAGPGAWSGRWQIDQRSGALVHQGTGRSYSMGDKVNVTIAAIDLALRRMDLIVTDARSRDAGKGKLAPGAAQAAAQTKRPGKLTGPGKHAPGGDDFFHRNRLSGSKRRSKASKQHDQAKPSFRNKKGKKKR